MIPLFLHVASMHKSKRECGWLCMSVMVRPGSGRCHHCWHPIRPQPNSKGEGVMSSTVQGKGMRLVSIHSVSALHVKLASKLARSRENVFQAEEIFMVCKRGDRSHEHSRSVPRWFQGAGVPSVRPERARAETRWGRDQIMQGLSKYVKGLALYPVSSREIRNSFN